MFIFSRVPTNRFLNLDSEGKFGVEQFWRKEQTITDYFQCEAILEPNNESQTSRRHWAPVFLRCQVVLLSLGLLSFS